MTSIKSISADNFIPPYTRPVTESIIALDGEQLLATIRIKGVMFDTVNPKTLDGYFNSEKNLFHNLCKKHGSKLAVWTHIVKRQDKLTEKLTFPDKFMNDFNDRYFERFGSKKFYSTDYYVTFVLKHSDIRDGISELQEIISLALNCFSDFKPTELGFYESRQGAWYSENISFLSFLLNNYFPNIPLTSDRIDTYISKSDLHFGYDSVEIRDHESDESKFAVLYDLDSYPNETHSGMWDFALSLQFEFIICQSMIFISQSKTIKLIDEQVNIIASSTRSESDLADLHIGREAVTNGDISFGDYHAAMIVFGDDVSSALENGAAVTSAFLSSGASTSWKRSNLKSLFTYQSMMPASKVRPLSAPRSVTNLCCGLSLHNFSTGKKTGNPVGDGSALMPLKTASESLYYFNCHASEHDKDVTGEPYAGHTMLLGMTGAGKTTLEAVLVGYATRFNPAIFAIDYNRSTELYIRAFGGQYFAIEDGVQTGLNPFQLEDSPKLRSFLYRLVERCGSGNDGLTANEEIMIKKAVDTVMGLDTVNRRFSTLLQSIPNGSDLRLRLGKWCHSENGSLAWALDSERNLFDPSEFNRIGFDTTSILKTDSGKYHPACEALLGVLFFMKEMMQTNGNLLITVVEEFWMPANFRLTAEYMKSILKAGRLRWEYMILSSQSPEDAINCNLFAAIVQQTPTKILLPNVDANPESYKKIGLTDKEVDIVLSLSKDSRQFLVKQGKDSVLAKMDLYGFEEFLPIISGNAQDIALCHEIRKLIANDDPDLWIPLMQKVKLNKKLVEESKLLHGSEFKDWLPNFLRMDI